MARHRRSRVSRGKVLLTLAVVAAGATAVGAGTYASFTTSANPGQLQVTAASLSLTVPAAGATNRMTVNATGIVPGDTMQRALNLTNPNGKDDLGSITLTTTASPSSLLDTDATNGLQLVIDKCSVPWTEAGVSPAYTYTCGGSTTSVLATRALIGSAISLSNLSALTANNTDYLRVKLTFPAGTGDTFQGLTSTITFTFNGTQRTASNR
jgi:spore coat-associated protein N